MRSGAAATASLCCGAALLLGSCATPASAAVEVDSPLGSAIIDVADTSYPILKQLKAAQLGPFTDKVADVILRKRDPKYYPNLAATLDLTIDWFLSIPAENIAAVNAAVAEGSKGLDPEAGCALVPLPQAAFAKLAASEPVAKIDPVKRAAFAELAKGSVGALARRGDAVCLPPASALETAALAQANAARAASTASAAALGTQAGATIKSVSLGAVLPLATQAQDLTSGATPAEQKAFAAAGGRIEKYAKAQQKNTYAAY